MRSYLKKLSWALLLSVLTFGGTYYWYLEAEKQFHKNNNDEVVAYVSKVEDMAQHRPADVSLWQTLNTNEPLYSGEAIRTSSLGEVRIHFKDSDKYLDLEADSLIVIQKSKGEIALDLMEGSLFVDAKNNKEGGSNLVLNSANGKVDLSGASANLSKNSKSGLSLQVLEGAASIKDKDGKTQTLESGKTGALGAAGIEVKNQNIEIVSPSITKPTYFDPQIEKGIQFAWKGAQENFTYQVHLGISRKNMSPIESFDASAKNSVLSKLQAGKYLWKIVGKGQNEQKPSFESPIYKLEVLPRLHPVLLSPENTSQVTVTQIPSVVTHKWTLSDQIKNLSLEIAKDSEFQQIIVTQKVSTQTQFDWKSLEEGTFFWRLSYSFNDLEKTIFSKPNQYNLVLFQKPKEPLFVEWLTPDPEQKVQYFVFEPKMSLGWQAKNRVEEVTQWRLKYYPEETPDKNTTLDIKENKHTAKTEKAGRYIASIEALDSQGKVLGASVPKTIDLVEKPKPVSPKILPETGPLNAENDGRFEVKWNPTENTKEYLLNVKSKDGKELANKKYSANSAQLKNLMPGEYTLQVYSLDEYGRQSEKAEQRTLLVPEKSKLKAPSLKKIKVN